MSVQGTAFEAMWAARDAAYWAGSAAAAAWVIGLGGLAINCVGLLFIRDQLKANRDALEATKESADAAKRSTDIALTGMRPWVKIEVQTDVENRRGLIAQRGDRRFVRIWLNFENIGETPALSCWMTAVHVPVSTDVVAVFDAMKGQLGRKTIFPGQTVPEVFEVEVAGGEGVFGAQTILTWINYRISGTDHVVHTPLLIKLLPANVVALVGFEGILFPGDSHRDFVAYPDEQPLDPD